MGARRGPWYVELALSSGLRVNASLLGTAFLLPRDYENLPSLVLVLADTHIKGDLVLLREKAKRTADVPGVSIRELIYLVLL